MKTKTQLTIAIAFALIGCMFGSTLSYSAPAAVPTASPSPTPTPLTITYDSGADRSLDAPKTVRDHEFVAFRAIHINTFLYNVSVTSSTQSFNTSAPAAFTSAILPTASSTPATLPAQHHIALPNGTPTPTPTPTPPHQVFLNALDTFNASVNAVTDLSNVGSNVTKLAQSFPTVDDSEITQIRNGTSNLVTSQVSNSLASFPFPSKTLPNGIDTDLGAALIKQAPVDLQNERAAYQALTNAGDADTSNAAIDKPLLTTAQTQYDQINTSDSTGDYDKTIVAGAAVIDNIMSDDAFTASGDGTASGDELTFTITPTAIDTSKTSTTPPLSPEVVNLEVIDGFHLNFSTGTFFSQLSDETPNIKTVPSATPGGATTYVIQKGSSDSFSTRVGALAHVYWAQPGDVQFAISAGVGTQDKSSVQYFLGGSVLFGQDQRFVLTVGVPFGSVERLSAQYHYGDTVSAADSTVTSNVNRAEGIFVGLTYNLSSSSTSSAAAAPATTTSATPTKS